MKLRDFNVIKNTGVVTEITFLTKNTYTDVITSEGTRPRIVLNTKVEIPLE